MKRYCPASQESRIDDLEVAEDGENATKQLKLTVPEKCRDEKRI